MNKLLHRQLRKHFGGADKIPENFSKLLNAISGSYDNYEKDRKMIESSIELSSKEMTELNSELTKEKEELKKAHKEQKNFFEDINEIVFAIDMVANRLIYTSAACEKIYGYTPEEFMSDNDLWLKIIYAEDKHIPERLVQLLRRGNPVLNDYRIVHKDGSIRWIENKIIPTLGADGRLTRINGVTSDITGRKYAEKELERSVSILEATIESTTDGILVVDFNGKIVRFNKKFVELWLIPKELLDQQDDEKAIAFVSAQLVNPEEFLCKIKELYVNREDMSFDILKFKDGRIFERYSQPQLINEICVGRVWNFRDITERQQAEDKLVITSNELQQALEDITKIMDSSLDVICAVDAKGNFLKVSAASKAVWGYKPEELIGKPLINFVYREDDKKTQITADHVMAGNNLGHFENRYIRKDGSLVPIEWSARWDEKDKIRYGVARDVTEKKRLERSFENERQRLNNLFSQAPASMGILKGANHVFEIANPLFLELIDKKDIIGKTVKEVLPELIEQGFIKMLDGVYETGETFSANEVLVKLEQSGKGVMIDKYMNFSCQVYRNIGNKPEGIFFFIIDVTEQVLSRKKIEESEVRYRQIVETAQEGIWLTDENSKTTFVNDKMCKILEYTQDEMIGKEIYYFMDEEGKQIAAQSIQERKGESGQYQFKYISGTKKEIWTNVSANPLFNETGEYKGSLAMVTDITENKKAEDKIKISELRYRSLIEQATDAICITDPSMKFIEINPYGLAMFGYTLEEALQLSLPDILFKEDLPANPIKLNELKLGKTTRNERRLKRKDGTAVDMAVSTKLMEDGRLIMFGHDITERKKAESALKKNEDQLSIAAQIAKLGYWEFDVLNDLFTFTDQFYAIFKTTAEKAGGYTMSSARYAELFVHPDEREIVGKSIVEAVNSEDSHFSYETEHRIIFADGEIGYVSVHFYIAKDGKGRTIKTFGVSQDITDRKNAEKLLQKSQASLAKNNRQLEQKNKELEQFAYVASHDMQEPLRTTSSFAELLQKQYKGKLDENADKYLSFITQSSDRMKVLIKDLLDYSRIGRKKELAEVDCKIMLNEVLADLGKAIDESNAEIKVDELPVISGYPTEIKQLFQNLIINAIKFRKQNTKPAITISVQKNSHYWEFAVKDNGIGINEQHRERIFIIFQRLHTRNEYDGSGIGLAHCKKIVELHGGRIWVESKPGEGSTFHFTIGENIN